MKKKEITTESSFSDFKRAYEAKSKLIKREKEDHLFALGRQWSNEDEEKLKEVGFKAFTDNRIAPNIYLLTGLERQNRTDFKAFPEGEEDGKKADIATALFKDAIKKSGFAYKSSEQFKDGIICGESHLELYLDNTESLINASPCWRKFDGDSIFPDPNSREYDFNDARYVYKLTKDVGIEDLINLYPEKKKKIEEAEAGKLGGEFSSRDEKHNQPKDYPINDSNLSTDDSQGNCFDLIERYYKKWIPKFYVGDKQTGEIRESPDEDAAQEFVANYRAEIERDLSAYQSKVREVLLGMASQVSATSPDFAILSEDQKIASLADQPHGVIPPPERDPERFIIIRKLVPEIWCFAQVPGIDEPLANERAWFYPQWKRYPFVPYFARFSTAPITGADRHLLIQGIVHGVKGAQEKHNQAEMLMMRHLNTSANSGWLAEEDSWVDADAVRMFGSAPGVNLEFKKGSTPPQRIFPSNISTGHAALSSESAEAIKAQLGINADLLATQQGSSQSGRAIALRQRQGLLMVQELFDNLSRSRQIAGKILLSQLGKIYDTETAMKVLGDSFLQKNFPPVMLMNPETGQEEPMPDEMTGEPMRYDKKLAELAIAEVLSGDLEKYDLTVGESVASETTRMANSAELLELSARLPVPPEILIRHTQLPEATKAEILTALQRAQAQAQAAALPPSAGGGEAGLGGLPAGIGEQ